MIKTVLAYLGYKGAEPDERTLREITEIHRELKNVCGKPKSVMGIFECDVSENNVRFGGINIGSKSLAQHLKSAKKVGVTAVTLGVEADRVIYRHSIEDISKSVIADAVASVMVNEYCAEICGELRFSPGYGDFDLMHQVDILRILDANKRIGLSCSDGFMLIPGKSVTAVIPYISSEHKGEQNDTI